MFSECSRASIFGVEKDKRCTYTAREKPSRPSLVNKEIDLKLGKNTCNTGKCKTKNCTTITGPQTGGEGELGGVVGWGMRERGFCLGRIWTVEWERDHHQFADPFEGSATLILL